MMQEPSKSFWAFLEGPNIVPGVVRDYTYSTVEEPRFNT